jgi:tellurium resistance protein TerD
MAMISLSKGQKIDLTKTNPGLKKVLIGLGWDTAKYDGGHDFDLDAAAFLTGDSGKVAEDKDFIFYNNLKHPSGSVQHLGDNLTGAGEGDDEQITIDLGAVPQKIQKLSFTVTIHQADERKQNFGMVTNAFIRVVNQDTNQELLRYDLSEDYSVETALIVGELYRHGGEWKFNAVGSGFKGGLGALCNNFGLNAG